MRHNWQQEFKSNAEYIGWRIFWYTPWVINLWDSLISNIGENWRSKSLCERQNSQLLGIIKRIPIIPTKTFTSKLAKSNHGVRKYRTGSVNEPVNVTIRKKRSLNPWLLSIFADFLFIFSYGRRIIVAIIILQTNAISNTFNSFNLSLPLLEFRAQRQSLS